MNNIPDLEKILETIIAIAQGLDKNSAEKVREIAQKLSADKDYRQLKMLEHAVLGMFEKLYTQCQQPKLPSKNYFIDDSIIRKDDDFEIICKKGMFSQSMKITYSGINVFDKKINENVWEYLREQATFKIITNEFDKIQFLKKIKQLADNQHKKRWWQSATISYEEVYSLFPPEEKK